MDEHLIAAILALAFIAALLFILSRCFAKRGQLPTVSEDEERIDPFDSQM